MIEREHVDLPAMPCPYDCGYVPNAAAVADGTAVELPSPDDYLVCFRCQQPGVYVTGPDGPSVRRATPLEVAEYVLDHGKIAHTLETYWERQNRT